MKAELEKMADAGVAKVSFRSIVMHVSRRRALVPWAPSILTALACLALLYAVHRPFFSPAVALNAKDEGYINAFAMRLHAGHLLPYVDAVSHRGPMLYWVAEAASKLGDPMTFVPIRALALVCGALIVTLAWVSAAMARRPLAAGIGSIGIAASLALEL